MFPFTHAESSEAPDEKPARKALTLYFEESLSHANSVYSTTPTHERGKLNRLSMESANIPDMGGNAARSPSKGASGAPGRSGPGRGRSGRGRERPRDARRGPKAPSRCGRRRPARARLPILPQPGAAVLSATAGLTSEFGTGSGDPRLHGRARAGRAPRGAGPGPRAPRRLHSAHRGRSRRAVAA